MLAMGRDCTQYRIDFRDTKNYPTSPQNVLATHKHSHRCKTLL